MPKGYEKPIIEEVHALEENQTGANLEHGPWGQGDEDWGNLC